MDDSFLLTPAAQVVAGLLALLLGRRVFWLFVALVGFFVGVQIGARIFGEIANWALLLGALLFGLIGAGLAMFLQRASVMLAGGIAGGMLAVRVAPLCGLYTEAGEVTAFVAGAILAAVLLAVLFDPVLIVISALIGGVMVAEAYPLDPSVELIVLVLLVLLGIAIQSRQFARLPERSSG